MYLRNVNLFYLSAVVAIIGTVAYHNLVKKIPASTDPMVSIIGIYFGVLVLGLLLMPLLSPMGKIMDSVHQLGWVQFGIAGCILLMELGFILMYRSGWELSAGNVVTGVFINIALMVIGISLFHEKLSFVNVVGVGVSIAGVAMVGYHRPLTEDVTHSLIRKPVQASLIECPITRCTSVQGPSLGHGSTIE
jgi:drug/metabolite transporter (DMT)-like permease